MPLQLALHPIMSVHARSVGEILPPRPGCVGKNQLFHPLHFPTLSSSVPSYSFILCTFLLSRRHSTVARATSAPRAVVHLCLRRASYLLCRAALTCDVYVLPRRQQPPAHLCGTLSSRYVARRGGNRQKDKLSEETRTVGSGREKKTKASPHKINTFSQYYCLSKRRVVRWKQQVTTPTQSSDTQNKQSRLYQGTDTRNIYPHSSPSNTSSFTSILYILILLPTSTSSSTS